MPSTCQEHANHNKEPTLHELYVGLPLVQRCDPSAQRRIDQILDAHLRGVESLIAQLYGDTQVSKGARHNVAEIRKLKSDRRSTDVIIYRRALFLFSLAHEPCVQSYFSESARGLTRVLPFSATAFFRNGHSPWEFVLHTILMEDMFADEFPPTPEPKCLVNTTSHK